VKAIGYFRETPGQGATKALAEQNKTFLELCQEQGYEVVASFVDGISADDDGRPGFRQLVEFLRRPEKGFVVVVVPSVEILGRDLREAARSWFQLESLGAQVLLMEGSRTRLTASWQRGPRAARASWATRSGRRCAARR
jgi:DNA invertase Pin-like site-specific DNA recombinase